MKNKVIITDNEAGINSWLDQGWLVKSVTTNHIGNWEKWCFVIEIGIPIS